MNKNIMYVPTSLVLACLTLALLMAACGPAATPQAQVPPPTPVVIEKVSTVVVERVVTPTPGPAKKSGGVLRVAISGDIDNFDPHFNPLEIYEDAIRNPVFSRLLRYDENQQLQADLAEKWEISPDSKTYTITLRKDAKFHNGKAVTTKDVEYTYTRIKPMASFINKRALPIDRMEIVDDRTIKFIMKDPQGWWLHDTTYVGIVPAGSGDDLKSKPIGSGPYKFKEWVTNDRIVLERNADYWNRDDNLADQIVFRVLPDVRSAIANLQSGQVDAVREVSLVDAVAFLSARDIRVVQSSVSNTFDFYHMTGLNNKFILNNKQVRQALNYALDKDAIQRTVFLGQGQQLTSPIPPSSPYHISPKGYPYDPEKCKQILDKEGVKNLEFSVEIPLGYPAAEPETVVWQAGLAKCGVKLNINKSELSVWLDKYLKQNYDVTWNTIGQAGDPNSFFESIIRRFVLAGVYNNPEMEELRAKAKQTANPDEAKKMLTRMQEIVNEDLPVVLIQTVPNISLVRSYVRDWKLSPDGKRLMHGVWLDK